MLGRQKYSVFRENPTFLLFPSKSLDSPEFRSNLRCRRAGRIGRRGTTSFCVEEERRFWTRETTPWAVFAKSPATAMPSIAFILIDIGVFLSMLSVSSYQLSTSRRADSNPQTRPEFSGASIIQRSGDSIDLTENADNSLPFNALGGFQCSDSKFLAKKPIYFLHFSTQNL